MRWALQLAAVVAAAGVASAAGGDDGLLWHAETLDGAVVASRGADLPFNPASVVKLATSLEVLDRLGPRHRWTTRVGIAVDGGRTVLVVTADGDPDLQPENVMLIARALTGLGVVKVDGGIVVRGPLTVGWEHGVDGRTADPEERRRTMAQRFRDALDPRRWDATHRASWRALAGRRGWNPDAPPRVEVEGAVVTADGLGERVLVEHRSAPLPVVLRRLNAYSNNDIVRVAEPAGAAGVAGWLERRLDVGPGEVTLATASGEGVNRLTASLVVRLLRAARGDLAARGMALSDLLPVSGCDPGPLSSGFSALPAGAVVGKTGTLRSTDGGVAVLAGIAATRGRGPVLFCVAASATGGRTRTWREREQRWLLDLAGSLGGMAPAACGPPLPFSDRDAVVEAVAGPVASRSEDAVR